MAELPPKRSVPLADQITTVERELKYRARVYSRMVFSGKMSETLKDREMANMRAVLETLREVQRSELLL